MTAAAEKVPFQDFLTEHAEAVGAYLGALVDPDSVEDCAQETFVAALRAYPRFDGGNGRAWVLKIARNKAVDYHRRRSRTAESLAGAPPVALEPGRDANDEIQTAVAQLPEARRSAVILRFGLDMRYREIGKALGCSEAAARQRVSEALRSLRNELTTEESGGS